MKWHDGIKLVLSQRIYLVLFIAASVLFSVVYIFSWNLILWRDMYIRYDLWTFQNLSFLATISVLSGLTFAMSAHNLKMNMAFHKKSYGLFAIFPSFFTSMCPTCAPAILSFSSAAFGIGMALTSMSLFINAAIIILLLVSLYFLSSSAGRCKVQRGKIR